MSKAKSTCPHCQKSYLIAKSNLGSQAKCAGCQKQFILTASPTSPPNEVKPAKPEPTRKPLTRKQRMLAGIKKNESLLGETSIRLKGPSLLYRFNILITALVMLMLPLVYLALIGLVIFGVYYHTIHSVSILGQVRGRGIIVAGMIYVTPIIAGVVLVLFMFKPLLAAPGGRDRRRRVVPEGEPILFNFVNHICRIVGAPKPKQIYIDFTANASASFENGWRSIFLGNNLSLTIGLPLVAGLNLQQFGGVMAHEFGHFSQGAGMRLSTLIRSINHWFERIVYERDAWDEGLESLSEGLDFRLAIIVLFVRLCVFLSRRILWCLMMIGHVVSCFLLRQMEFDADRYEYHFAGSKAFATTSDRIVELNVAFSGMMPTIIEMVMASKTLPDLPKAVSDFADDLPREAKKKIKEYKDEPTGLLDTHPSNKHRIACAKDAKQEGVFHSEDDASFLFVDFKKTCESVTEDFYRNALGVSRRRLRS